MTECMTSWNSEENALHELYSIRASETVTTSHLNTVHEALACFPHSVLVLCTVGDIACLVDKSLSEQLEDPLVYYQRAVVIDPECWEAWESIGYYFDVYKNDLHQAEQAFRKAIEFGAEAEAYSGLARVLCECGRRAEALQLLKEGAIIFPGSKAIRRRINEIRSGEWEPIE